MWLFAKHGFLSIVQHENRPDLLLVRGRIKGDVEHFFRMLASRAGRIRDYLYRTMLPKQRVAERIASAVSAISYPKFKPAVEDRRREEYYFRVWDVGHEMQQELSHLGQSNET